MLYVVQRKH